MVNLVVGFREANANTQHALSAGTAKRSQR